MVSKKKRWHVLFLCFLLLSGCTTSAQQAIINRQAEAQLTRSNELLFRFKINENIFLDNQAYQVRVTIHNKKLASALGTDEILYGSNTVSEGAYIDVNNEKDAFIFMDPLPLQKDLHVFEIEDMIVNKNAVSVEVLHEKEVIARAYLNHFSSQF